MKIQKSIDMFSVAEMAGMYMRKSLVLGIAGFILTASVVMPVSAHGHHHAQTDLASDRVCEVCTVEGCKKSGLHVHDDETYCGYAHKGGYCDGSCGAVEVCTVEGCTETGHHTHNNEAYCGYAHKGGYCDGSCGAVGVCTVEGCTETGHHTHNKETYCGYAHESGYCDNSCVKTTDSGVSGHCGHRRHHGK